MQLRELVFWSASLTSVGQFFTGIPVCQKIILNGSTSESSFFPLIIMFISSVLWIKYGLLERISSLVFTNYVGAFLSLFYITVYYAYTSHRKNLHKQLLIGLLLLIPPLIYVKYYAQNNDDAVQYLGYSCAATSVLFYGSPLSATVEVLTTRTTACMALPMSIGNFLASVQWFIYGRMLKDLFVQIPNGVGIILAFIQLGLFLKFPHRNAAASSRYPTHLT